jgi:two-component system, LytTR family, sensor kinase
MKKFLFLLIFIGGCNHKSLTQVNWRDTTLSFSGIEWNNYSTSYMGEQSDSVPLLVTAIPYNGIYSLGDGSPERSAMDMTFSGSAFHFRSNLSANQQALYTYDSSAVYFLAPGIFRSNAAQFEYRVLLNNSIVRHWSNITEFTDTGFQLNEFRRGFAFLGGYNSSWDNYIVVELRRKNQQQPLASTTVYWKQTRPVLLSILTMHELNERLLRMKNPFDLSFTTNDLEKWKTQYRADQLDSVTGLPKRLILPQGEKELLFFVSATIYRKEALEYQLKKNGRVFTPWQSNDIDNNFVWLRNLGPGDYVLEMRYSKQRHNLTTYSFKIKPAWFQTLLFKFATIGLALVMLGFLVLLFKLKRQRQKTAAEQAKHEKLMLGLKSVHAQLNPHFIFNALSSIQGLINKNDIPGANSYLSVFGSLVRSSLTNSEKQFIPLESEISTLETYLTLEKLRFNFSYSIHSEEQLPVATVEVPSLLLQPLVENAVKHGVALMHQKGTIRIEFCKQETDLLARVIDNGQGFIPGLKQEGYGLKLTKDRIQLLNELSQDRIIEMTINSFTGGGTTIELLFKNWLA